MHFPVRQCLSPLGERSGAEVWQVRTAVALAHSPVRRRYRLRLADDDLGLRLGHREPTGVGDELLDPGFVRLIRKLPKGLIVRTLPALSPE